MGVAQFSKEIFLRKICSPILRKAAYRMCHECSYFIERGSKILDVGCGTGFWSSALKSHFQTEVFGVDIEDLRMMQGFPFQLFDGKQLLFSDDFFDIVIISYVLHHTRNYMGLIAEARRVTKDKIIVYEDLSEGIFGKLGNFLHRLTYGFIYPSQKEVFNFKSRKSWEKIFSELKLEIISEKKAKTQFQWIYPHNATIFFLKKII